MEFENIASRQTCIKIIVYPVGVPWERAADVFIDGLTHSLKLSLPPPGSKSSYIDGKPYDFTRDNNFHKNMIYNVISKPNGAGDGLL